MKKEDKEKTSYRIGWLDCEREIKKRIKLYSVKDETQEEILRIIKKMPYPKYILNSL